MIADRQIVAVLNASGRYEERPLPTIAEQRALLDAALFEEPQAVEVDTEQMQLRRVLGVG